MQAKLSMVDHKAHRYPDQPRVPCVYRRTLMETVADVPFYRQPGYWRRECPRPLRSMGPLGLGWFPNTVGP